MQLVVESEVTAARAVVALESTLVAHGLPWPDNLAVARELEDTVRAHGGTPATIAVVDGAVRIGLGGDALVRLARDGAQHAKAGATDLAVHLARKSSAATTVSATAMLAAHAGIKVFATGGIGGVHRGDADDVSHDLVALSRTPIVVVSAGAKAILDLPRTLEMLETLGVLVVGYRTNEFPAFYSPRSGLMLEHRAESAQELADIVYQHWQVLGSTAGVLVCNPIPDEAAIDVDDSIVRALEDATLAGVTGKRLTPFLLARLADVTAGGSIRANRVLALNNARVAAEIAVAIAADRA